MEKQVLVVRRIHNTQRQDYDATTIEVSESIADEQLSLVDKERNHTWKGVRYATAEEAETYYKANPASRPIVEKDEEEEQSSQATPKVEKQAKQKQEVK